MTPSLIRKVIYPLHERLLNRPTFSYLHDLEMSQFLDRADIERLQMDKLKLLLQKAHAHCPWYTNLIEQAEIEIHSDKYLTMDDLRCLPTINKQTATDNSKDMLWRDAPGGIYPYSTGGSSGEPLRFYFGRMRQASDAAGRMRARRWWGVDVGDREVYLWGAPVELNKTDIIKTIRDRLFNQMVLNAFEMSPANMDEYIEAIRRYRPRCIYGYASSIALLASHARERGEALTIPSLKVVCTTGEPIYPHQRQLIQEMFGVPVANEFGSRDIGFTAHEAPDGHMLLMSESIIMEILDANDNPVAPGETGEAVITGLCSEVQPFIRYRTGDMVAYSKEDNSGGRGLHVLDSVAGRSTDFVVRPDGAIMHALSVIYEIRDKPGVEAFKFIQHDLLHCEVQIVSGDDWLNGSTDIAIIHDLQARLGNDVDITISKLDRIPVEASGKHRYVISHVPLPGGLVEKQ